MTKEEMRAVIIKTLGRFPVDIDEGIVLMLEKTIASKADSRQEKNLPGFVYTIVRNWAVDQLRRKAATARRNARTLLEETAKKKNRELQIQCRREFEEIVLKISAGLRCVQSQHLALVRVLRFQGFSTKDISGITLAQRYQWVSRGVKLVTPYASQELKEFLCRRRKR